MKNIRKFIIVTLAVFASFSCVDEDKKPILTFDDSIKGAYVRLISEGDKLVNLLDIAGSSYVYTVEFVDLQGGALVTDYILELDYEDNDASNGDNSTVVIFRSYAASDFALNENGFLGLVNITITADQLFTAAGVVAADVSPGDNFNINGSLTLIDGSVHTADNSSAAVNGGAFRGHTGFIMPASCPSDLGGTYDVTTVINPAWCGTTINTTVDLVDEGAGVYSFSDWSFGAYPECYGGFCCAQGSFAFTDVCTVVTISDGDDTFGDSWTFSSSIVGNDLIVVWDNFTYNAGIEAGTSTITFPGGVPFTLAP